MGITCGDQCLLTKLGLIFAASLSLLGSAIAQETSQSKATTRPNIVFIMADDHAAHAISAYGSKINSTPNIDSIGAAGMRLLNCFATNALCAPSRATILTGKYSHKNGVKTHHGPPFDGSQVTYPKLLQNAGYQTAIVGKWHLKSDPTGFDYWDILVGQGRYFNPRMIEMGTTKTVTGYATDIIANKCIEWLDKRDTSKPFLLVCQHKAPHRPWQPDEKHKHMYDNVDIPTPPTFDDDYSSRSQSAKNAHLRIAKELNHTDLKIDPPANLKGEALKKWKYERFIKDYLACIASVDDNVGRLLSYLKDHNLMDNTIIIYTSDQGFFLGDHGWFDKRFMYEESLRMPFLVSYPKEIKAGSTSDAIVTNVDFAPTFLDFAGVKAPAEMQGQSFRPVLDGDTPTTWPKAMYYHFYEYNDPEHHAARHYGVRTDRYKLIHYYHPIDEWELFDLKKDPHELNSVYADPAYAGQVAELKAKLKELRAKYQDTDGDDPSVNDEGERVK